MRLPLLLPTGILALATGLLAPLPTTASAAPTAPGTTTARQVHHTQWDTADELATGRRTGTVVSEESVVLGGSTRVRTWAGRRYDEGRWTSPWTIPGFGLTQLVGSWTARTPGDSWVEVRVRGRDASGATSSWDVLGRWAAHDRHLRRTSVAGQDDDLATVDVDTWKATGAPLTSWQLEVSLLRRSGGTARPSLDAVGAMSSAIPSGPVATSRPGVARGIVLDVPRYSQMVHEGHYPQWGGGGEAWCSPTSVTMVLGYYDALPRASAYAWVPDDHRDGFVDHAARSTYDAAYAGTGNWSFSTAYAAGLAGHGFVTRLTSLRQAERFIAQGIPLVASISFGSGDLSGAPISASAGHLLVVVGFTEGGDVVVNDPAADPAQGERVRRTYDRAQLERAWLTRSGGLVYVVHDDAHPLPTGRQTNW